VIPPEGVENPLLDSFIRRPARPVEEPPLVPVPVSEKFPGPTVIQAIGDEQSRIPGPKRIVCDVFDFQA
jgi:hypothetical protein